MYDYKQRETTDDYRDNWDRIYSKEKQDKNEIQTYKNGCPILEETDASRD